MKCLYCGEEMKLKNTLIDLRVGDKLYIIEEVPAFVCERCGEKVMTQEVAERVHNLIKEGKEKTRLQVPVLSYSKS